MGVLVILPSCILNSIETAPAEAIYMFLVPIALIIVVIDLMQFIGWVVPSRTCVDVILDSSTTKLQCSMFYMKRTMNRVYICMIASILRLK